MPWTTPTLREVRSLVRDAIHGSLPGSDATVPNSVLRVMSDAQGALCFLTLEYIDWLALQLLPDTAETEWLDRHGDIWLSTADGSRGRKTATFASGTVLFTGLPGSVLPAGAILSSPEVQLQTTEAITVGSTPAAVAVTALSAGIVGNLEAGSHVSIVTDAAGVDSPGEVERMFGGTDEETDEQLRFRVLERIQAPPMGGDAEDYVMWTLRVPGVTRAWSYPLEMGIGTVTVRFMMDELRASQDGFPTPDDVDAVQAYLDTVRPVAVKDFFVVAPLPFPIDFSISQLKPDNQATRDAIEVSIKAMLKERAIPGQTIYKVWKSDAVLDAVNVVSFDLGGTDDVMPSVGHLATLGDIYYDP